MQYQITKIYQTKAARGHSDTNKIELLARSTSGPRPSPQSEIPCGGWREHTGQAQTLVTQFP